MKPFKTCEIMQYLDCLGYSFDELEQRLKLLTNLKTYCMIIHDRDKNNDGSLKAAHFHAILTFTNNKTLKCISTALDIKPQFIQKIKGTTLDAQLYLIHYNSPEKFQYSADCVRSNFDYPRLLEKSSPKNLGMKTILPQNLHMKTILPLIEDGSIREYNLSNYVPIEFYVKYKQNIDRAFQYVLNKKRGLNRSMECFYVYGDAGVGKTTFAKDFAEHYKYSTYVSSGGKNPLDDYKGQDCIILDDIRPDTFSAVDFLKLTDNHTDSMVGCRYYNKSISYCKLIICTSVYDITKFANLITMPNDEPSSQFYRRFKLIYKITFDSIEFYEWDRIKNSVLYKGFYSNNISLINPNRLKKTEEYINSAKSVMDKFKDSSSDDLPPQPKLF